MPRLHWRQREAAPASRVRRIRALVETQSSSEPALTVYASLSAGLPPPLEGSPAGAEQQRFAFEARRLQAVRSQSQTELGRSFPFSTIPERHAHAIIPIARTVPAGEGREPWGEDGEAAALGRALSGEGLGDLAASPGAEAEEQSFGHTHFSHRAAWLRAALLGAQDGLVSVSSLIIGVGAVHEDRSSMVVSGLAGLVAGACSMAIGEYISVHGQRDVEEADVQTERAEFEKGPEAVAQELEELTQIYVARGLNYSLAREVALELSATDPWRAHCRDELGIDVEAMSNPAQAALASAVAFLAGGIVPLLSAAFIQLYSVRVAVVLSVSTLMFLFFGALGAWLGGARQGVAALRSTIGGLGAMSVTYGILRAFGSTGL